MYRECFVGADQALLLIIVILIVMLAGAIAAAERNGYASRKHRKLYQDEAAAFRQWKRERSWDPPSFAIDNHRPEA